ncbi:PepSY domain-containing protein [Sulfurimonas sp.]|uniref:PepSY domain-containing protein n=1 Tax=Sulfurimonas sp. TaxID=2022749 RepID=UPI002B4A1D9F|nr:PepSY domain-containing protein [Sulfurimonas sp.]
MKYLPLLLAPIFAFASQAMTPMEHSSIHGYNKNPNLKIKTEQKKKKLSNIKDKEARKIVKKATTQEVEKIQLIHLGDFLIYKATTKDYKVQVNAIDGTIMKKESK